MNSKHIKKKNAHMAWFLFLILFSLNAVAQKLYVYYPVSVKPTVIQGQFEKACPGIEITVFGRYKDFTTMLTQVPPDAFITKTELAKRFSANYTIKLNAVKNGKTTEKYVALSVKDPVKPADLGPTIIVGALDFLGRTEMNKFMAKLTGATPKVKRVAKVEDLLPLLSFNMGKAIILTTDNSEIIKKKSNLNFVESPLKDQSFGIAALAVSKTGNGDKIVQAVKNVKSIMGIDKWQ